MRKLWDPFFFAKVSSSAITTSFQQVHLRRSEAPAELQVIHSERVARERSEALCSPLEGVGCQNASGAKHRSFSGTKLPGGIRPSISQQKPWTPPQLRASLANTPPHHFVGKLMQKPTPNRVQNACSRRNAFA